jgi:hypothetical protein
MGIGNRAALALAMAAISCGDEGGDGSLRVRLVPEETISEGLKVGQDEENTRDFAVSYSKFVIAVGRVKLANTAEGTERSDPTGYIADLRQLGTDGVELTTFQDLPSGQWDKFGFETPQAAAGFQKLGTVSDADVQTMITEQLTYWIVGTVQATPPVDFDFKIPIASLYTNCENDGEPGVSISADRTQTADLTIHGDHLWFDSLSRGDETTVTRRAGWLVKADKDGDRKVTTEELKQVRADELFSSSEGYNLSGPMEVVTAYDFVRAQLSSQGHLNGEGECYPPPS